MRFFPQSRSKRPLKDVSCPLCGAKAVYVARKACCASCGWNIDAVRRYWWRVVGKGILGFCLMLLFWYAPLSESPSHESKWIVLLPTIFGLAMLVGWIAELRALPKVAVQPRSAPEPEFRILPRSRLQRKPIDGWVLREIISVPMIIFFIAWFLPHELEHWPSFSGKAFVLFIYVYFAYALVAHALEVVRLGREWLAEAHLVRRAEATMGRVVDQTPFDQVPNRIKYVFRDGFNHLQRGSGKDYSDQLFEGLQVAVLYDPDDPTWNLPASGLNFHVLAPGAL